MKVLLAITDLEIGGTPRQVYHLATGLKRRGVHVRVACLAGPGPVADRLIEAEVAVFPLGARGVWDLHIVWSLRQLIRALRPDICHSFLIHANVVTRVAAINSSARVISTICTAEREHRWHLVLENMTCRLGDAVVCVSQAVRSHMHRHAFIPWSAMAVIHPGIDLAAIRSADAVPRASLTHAADRPLIGYVGRLDPVKRVDLILRAISALRNESDAALVIVGDGPERGSLEHLAEREHLGERVRFLGFRDDVPGILKSCDLMVLASDQEGWSISTTEALAAGVPVVATDVPGLSEQIEPTKTGFLVPPGDVRHLAAGIRAGLKLAKPVRCSRPIEHLSYTREVEEYYNLYYRLLSGRSRS